MSKKRRREKLPIDSQLVEVYEDLANLDEKIRLKAAYTLLQNFVGEGNLPADQFNEILRRLIRGLCSGRKAARLGFSVALTEFLTACFGWKRQSESHLPDVQYVIEMLKAQAHATGNASGQEERDHQFGRLFGADSILKSGIIAEDENAIEVYNQVLDIVFDLAKQKPWLQEDCGFVLCNAVQRLRDRDTMYAHMIINKLISNQLGDTPDGVAIWIVTKSSLPAIKLPHGIWRHEDPLDRKEVSRLARILVKANASDFEFKSAQNGVWSTKLHFAWETVISSLRDHSVEGSRENGYSNKRISFANFWENCVENTLYSPSSSEERKYWGFLLVQRVIKDFPVDMLLNVFTPNFMRCLMNQLSIRDRYLHRAADKSLKGLLARARSQPLEKGPILRSLVIGPHGGVNFDKLTKTKTIETLLALMTDASFTEVKIVFDSLIGRPGTQDEKEAAHSRQIAADQLICLLRSLQVEQLAGDFLSEDDTHSHPVLGILSMFAKYSFFDLESKNGTDSHPTPPISQASRNMFRTRLSSSLAHLLGKSPDPTQIAYALVKYIHDQVEGEAFGKLLLQADENVQDVFRSAQRNLDWANKTLRSATEDDSRSHLFKSIQLLYCLTFLQVYNNEADAVNILQELDDLFPALKKGKELGEESAAMVEMLKSFVARRSQLFRRLAEQVFTAFAPTINKKGLQSLLIVLDARESLAGQAEMFEQEEPMEDASEASDVVDIDGSNAGSITEDESGNEDIISSPESENEPDNNYDDMAKLDAELAAITKTRPGIEDVDATDTSSSDEDMDDEQMEKLDRQLETFFRESKKITSKKIEKKDAKETIVNFKCRVLDLLKIYVKQQHANILATCLVLPILRAIQTTQSPLVSDKACDVIKDYVKLCKGDGLPSLPQPESIFTLLEAVHVEAQKESSNAHANACSQASLLLVKVLAAHDRGCLRRVVRIYGKTQEVALFDTGCKVRTSFFTDWQNWWSTARK